MPAFKIVSGWKMDTLQAITMIRLRQLVSCYLALCLLGGGAVELSPVLHHWIEHGGHGTVHSHANAQFVGANEKPGHRHGDGLPHEHATEPLPSSGFFTHAHEPFGLPKISLGKLWNAAAHLLETTSSRDAAPSENDPGHHHNSIFQLLAAGLIDQAPVPLPLPLAPHAIAVNLPAADERIVIKGWDAQSASRGPPGSRS